jgi:type IV pilus assembly protein PilA
MAYAQTLRQTRHCIGKYAAILAAIFLVVLPCCAQSAPPAQQSEMPWTKELNKYPGLLPEFGRLVEKLKQNIQFPAPRAESRLLPLLPAPTVSYAAFPNYGDVTQQALKIFRQELQESTVLRDWWGHGDLATAGPKTEDALEKFYQFQQYLGEEIVVSGAMESTEPRVLVVAEIRKPGLKKFLDQLLALAPDKSTLDIRVLDQQELAAQKDGGPKQIFNVLVRADYLVASSDLATLRSFNARLDAGSKDFVATPFGQRVAKEYAGGVTILAAANLHKILDQIPPSAKQNSNFQHSGFADVKYVVWDRKSSGGPAAVSQTLSQTELSFNAPRQGPAAWLAKPGPLSSLDFVSPKAIVAGTVVLTSPSQVFNDLKEIEGTSSQSPFASLAAFEKMLNLSLRDDLLKYLTGEITVELDSVAPPKPVWKAILKVNDAGRLQQTLTTLLAAGHLETKQAEEGGVTYHTVAVPSGNATVEIGYAFVDGYLVVASSREVVADTARLHASGQSLGKSQKFLAAMPPGHTPEASALLYQDPVAMAAVGMRQAAPEMAEFLAQFSKEAPPTVVCFYGEEAAIREASKGGSFDVGAALVVAAIAVPNLLRARMAANEATAVGSLRTVNTAEIAYAGIYPERGYAPDLATLGTDSHNLKAKSPNHAGLIDATLANDTCTANAWCTKSGYRFRVTTLCKQQPCKNYLAIGMPVDGNTGIRSFCSTSDAVIRYKTGATPSVPASVAECKTWSPLR